MAIELLPIATDKDASGSDYTLLDTEVNALGHLAELYGPGFFGATDYNLTAPGGLAVTVGIGRALIRDSNGDLQVAYAPTATGYDDGGGGLPASQATVYVWLLPDGTIDHTTTSTPPDADALLCGLGSTNATDFSVTSSLPAGRTNLTPAKITSGSVTVDPASLATLTSAETAVTIPGAEVGDVIIFNVPASLETGIVYSGARVSAANTAQLRLTNITAGSVDPASRTWTYVLIKLA